MKLLAVVFSLLVGLVASRNVFGIENNSAYGYLTKVGMPLAKRIREAETQSSTRSVAPQQIREAVGPSARIVKGLAARPGDVPYQAGLLVDYKEGQSVCGGSLLNARRVLTAAHCWWDGENKAWRFTVVLGSVKLYTGGTRLKTSKVIMHSEWNPRNFLNDIAMVYLPKPVQFSDIIKPIALPSGPILQESFTGQTVIASGFGQTRDGEEAHPNTFLSYVHLQVINNEVCARVFENIWPTMICTTGVNYKSICGGDSGGPLAFTSNNSRILVGITSFGSVTCEKGHPGGFTRVTSYVDWIKNLL